MKLSTILREKIEPLVEKRDGLLAVDNADDFTTERSTQVKELNTQLTDLRAQLAEAETAEAAEGEARSTVTSGVAVVSEANPVYTRNGSASFFRDMFAAGVQGDAAARERLARSQARALNTGATAGGAFAPPAWLIEDFVANARASRVVANLVNQAELPEGVSSINLPRVATGTSVGVTDTENSGISNTDLTTDTVSSDITTIAGMQIASLQLLKQSGIPLDQVILGDLAAAYASKLDEQVIAGSGASGQLEGLITAGTDLDFTSATPAVVSDTPADSFYHHVIAAIANMANTRFMPANAIVMSPIRWGWVLGALDNNTRPLVVPNTTTYNGLGSAVESFAEGPAGTFAGLPVYLDPNIPSNLGTAEDEDVAFVLRTDDLWLYETPVEAATFEATYANQNSVLFRVLGFSAFLTRHESSVQVITGTGMVVPTL